MNEATLVDAITKTFEALGYRVMEVCQRGGFGSGTTVGYPDLSVRHDAWPPLIWALLEVKTDKGVVSPAQEAIRASGGSAVVRSVGQALVRISDHELLNRDDDGAMARVRRIERVLEQLPHAEPHSDPSDRREPEPVRAGREAE